MRNKWPGKCHRCHEPVGPGDGRVVFKRGRHAVIHDGCVAEYQREVEKKVNAP